MRREAGTLFAIITLFAAVCVDFAPPSAAADLVRHAGPFYYVTSSRSAGTGTVSQSSSCPAGTFNTGSGGAIGATAASAITNVGIGSAPAMSTLEGVRVGTTGSSSITAVAVCVTSFAGTPSFSGQAGGIAAGAVLDQAQTCGGATIIGGGSHIAVAAGALLLASFPIAPDTWTTRAYNGTGATTSFGTNYTCLAPGAARVRYRRRSALVQPGRARTLRVSCPRRFHVSSGGFAEGGLNMHALRSVPIDTRDRDRAPDDGWSFTTFNGDNAPAAATVYAICVK